jgi:hemolysin
MSDDEYKKMLETGKVQMSDGNITHVINPSDIEAFKAAKKGSVFVEFDISNDAIHNGGKEGWSIIPGPNSMLNKYRKIKGLPTIKEPQDVFNIKKIGAK